MSSEKGTRKVTGTFSFSVRLTDVTLPSTITGDPQTTATKRISLELPEWAYWQLVSVGETESVEPSELFYIAARALIADFDAVEAIALKKIVSRLASEGHSDPAISKMLDIPPRRVRQVRNANGIESQVRGRGKKKPKPEIVELVA